MLALPFSRARILCALSAALVALAVSGCSTTGGHDSPVCRPPEPAFALVIHGSPDRPLTRATVLRVSSGDGIEMFDIAHPPPSPEVVFCSVLPPGADAGVPDAGGVDATDGGTDVGALACSLWTDGAADVTVTSPGFLTVTQSLEARTGKCGVETIPVELVLTADSADAGM